MVLMLQGAIAAATKVGLMLNVRREDLASVLSVLPALKNPTISTLSDSDWVAVNTIIEEAVVRQILPKLKAAKAQGDCRISSEQDCPLMRTLKLTAATEKVLFKAREEEDRDALRVAGRIVEDVRRRGDKAAETWTQKLDKVNLSRAGLWVTPAEFSAAKKNVNPEFLKAVQHAITNVRLVAEKQKPVDWTLSVEPGVSVGADGAASGIDRLLHSRWTVCIGVHASNDRGAGTSGRCAADRCDVSSSESRTTGNSGIAGHYTACANRRGSGNWRDGLWNGANSTR